MVIKKIDWVYSNCCFCGSNHSKKIIDAQDYEVDCETNFSIVKCSECGLCYTNPRPSMNQLLKDFYPDNYLCYNRKDEGEQNLLESFFSYRTNEPRLKLIEKHIAKRTDEINILEIGCSDGYLLKYLKNRTQWNLYGLEPNIKISSNLKNIGINISHKLLCDSDYQCNFFDVIFMLHVLEHTENPFEELKNAYKLLKKNGALIIETPNIEAFDRKIFGPYWWGYHLPRHLTHFSKSTLNSICAAVGFKSVSNQNLLRFGSEAWNFDIFFRRRSCPKILKSFFSYSNPALMLLVAPLEIINYIYGETNLMLNIYKK